MADIEMSGTSGTTLKGPWKQMVTDGAPRHQKTWKVKAAFAVGMVLVAMGLLAAPHRNVSTSSPVMIPTWTLANGVEYPRMLSNTADLTADQTYKALKLASSIGIKGVDFHDNAEMPGVAQAVAELGRDAFFLTTKINKPPADMASPDEAKALTRKQFADDMAALGVGYLDTLMLKDSPSCPVMQAMWEVVEELYAKGLVRSIGLYNLCEASVACVFETATVKPMIHYLMRHAGMGADMDGLIGYGTSLGMKHTVYGSLGEPIALPELLSDDTLKAVAIAHGRTVEEVAIKWNSQSGLAVNLRLNSNYGASNKASMPSIAPYGSYCTDDCIITLTAMSEIFDWDLTSDEMALIDSLRFTSVPQSPTYYSSSGCPRSFGATMAQASTQSSCPSSGSTWC